MFRLDGKTALVTGSATGLGAAIAYGLAEAGASVVVSDLPGVDVSQTVGRIRQLDRPVAEVAIDVTQVQELGDRIAQAEAAVGPIDILVSNAGLNRPAAGYEVAESDWELQFAVNVKGSFFVAQAAARRMRERQRGVVVFMASQSGLVGIPGQPTYCATKGAVIQLVRTLGIEWIRDGIRVAGVAPTFVETDLTRRRLNDPEYRSKVLAKLPGGKLATATDVAAAVVYLASDEARMVNATVLSVDGGWTAW